MKKIAIIVLSVALAAAIVSGLIFHLKYIDTKDALLISENNLSGLHEKLAQLNQETSMLQDQLRKSTERLKELEGAKERVSELENAITVKDHRLSEYEETLHALESWDGEKKFWMKGNLAAIDLRYHTVVIEVPLKGKEHTVGGPLSPEAILKRSGQSVSLADFQIGDQVIFIWESTKKGHVILSLKVK